MGARLPPPNRTRWQRASVSADGLGIVCTECKKVFVAVRATASFCSNKCKCRAMRRRNKYPPPLLL